MLEIVAESINWFHIAGIVIGNILWFIFVGLLTLFELMSILE